MSISYCCHLQHIGDGFYPVYWDMFFMGICDAVDTAVLPETFDKNEVTEVWHKFSKYIVSVMQDGYIDGLKNVPDADAAPEAAAQQATGTNEQT